jgi:hypothetical protein
MWPWPLSFSAQAVANGDPLQAYASVQPYAGISKCSTDRTGQRVQSTDAEMNSETGFPQMPEFTYIWYIQDCEHFLIKKYLVYQAIVKMVWLNAHILF